MSQASNLSDEDPWMVPDGASFQHHETMSAFINEVFTSRSLVDADGNAQSLDTFIPSSQGDLLYSLVRHLRPHRTLEVGLANGISALYITTALHENGHGQHIAIDPYQKTDWRSVGLVTLDRAGLGDLVTLDARPSHWVLPDLDETNQRIQFAFIDGSHLMDYVMTDFMAIDRILDVGGLIAFDDSDWPAVHQVIRFALANCDYTVFPTGVIIEPNPERPHILAKGLRTMVRRCKPLQKIVRNDFTYPPSALEIEGRCVVLQKNGDDQRHALQGKMVAY